MKVRLLCGTLTLLLLFAFTACGKSGSDAIRYDVSHDATILDPQFATDTTAQIVIGNTFEGLVRKNMSGEIVLSAAESYTVSSDQRTYTFTLKEGMTWQNTDEDTPQNGDPVTAQDFVFAFQRMFNPSAVSPHATRFLAIQNAAKILDGEMNDTSLGVSAPDSRTVVFKLDTVDPTFLLSLTSTAASPCHEAYFIECKGRYGMETNSFLSNGPFNLKSWNSKKSIVLSRNENYYDAQSVLTPSVHLYIGREGTAAQKLADKKTDGAKVSYDELQSLLSSGVTYEGFDDTTWMIAFNTSPGSVYANDSIRKALASSINRVALAENVRSDLVITDRIIPSAVSYAGHPFYQLSGPTFALGYSPVAAKGYLASGLEELSLSQLPQTDVLIEMTQGTAWESSASEGVEDNSFQQKNLKTYILQMWQKELALFQSPVFLDTNTLQKQMKADDFSIVLIALKPSDLSPDGVLSHFVSDSPNNIIGYKNPEYDALIHAAQESPSAEQTAAFYTRGEKMLIDDAIVIPLYHQTTYYTMAQDVHGIEFSPNDGNVYFKYAVRNG